MKRPKLEGYNTKKGDIEKDSQRCAEKSWNLWLNTPNVGKERKLAGAENNCSSSTSKDL